MNPGPDAYEQVMRPSIGHDYLHNGILVHCQDTDNLDMMALVGVPDENDMIWEPYWVSWSELVPA